MGVCGRVGRLLDVREVFGRLDKETCSRLLEPGIDSIAAGVAGRCRLPVSKDPLESTLDVSA